MSVRANPRGQPVLVLATILGGWTVMRVLLWSSPFPAGVTVPPSVFDKRGVAAVPAAATEPQAAVPGISEATGSPIVPSPWEPADQAPVPFAVDPSFAPPPPAWLSANTAPVGLPAGGVDRMRRIAGQHILLAAGFSNMALPPEIAAFYDREDLAATPATRLAVADRPLLGARERLPDGTRQRWSADGWVSWRDGSGNAAATAGAASYGRSQGGAVVRYRLAPGPLRPEAFARATRTLQGPRQAELAVGASVRLVPSLPVRVAAEGRVTETAAGREVRPAIFAVTELPPARLPLGLRGEGYAQAGYVGGNYATAFVDGQARVDGKLARPGEDAELRAGLATWGGAQKGAARLDVGPSATLSFRLGEARSRVAVDYRIRVAGDAEPGSGPVLTFSAGF